MLEEYHKLNYEDHVGGINTRFRYKEVEPENYGLSVEEILMMDDRELNQVVGLKKVAAPYREGERKLRPNYGKLNEWRQEKERDQFPNRWKDRKEGGGHGDRKSDGDKKFKRSEGGEDGKEDTGEEREERKKEKAPKLTVAEARLASFAVPSLKKRKPEHGGGYELDGGAKRKKSKGEGAPQQAPQQAAVAGLSKAQRKNMKRSAKRAAKKGTDT